MTADEFVALTVRMRAFPARRLRPAK